MTLMLHCGGFPATKADLAAVPVPDATESYVPVPYPRLLEEVELHVPRFGLKIERGEFALNREGRQMFGVLECSNGTQNRVWNLAIGLRSSYDRSLAVELVAGSHVFACDNLAFHGEAAVHRKHTVNIFRDLPDMIYTMLGQVSTMKDRMAHEIEAMQEFALEPAQADHILVEAVRRNVLPASHLPKVMAAWEEPDLPDFEPRNAWSLFNAFTGIHKARPAHQMMDESLRLTRMFREVLVL